MPDPSPPVLPAHDDIEGLAPPRAQARLIGHRSQIAAFAEAVGTGHLHHAWLLSGIRGIGKATCAYRFARGLLHHGALTTGDAGEFIANDDAVGAHTQTFRLIAQGSHTNMIALERRLDPTGKRYRTVISVDDVRSVGRFFATTAARAGWRICIIDTADDLNHQAANALLKLLEEPPPNALFLLVSHRPGRLLATLRSRCRRLDFQPLSSADIETGLSLFAPQVSQDARADAVALANGSLRRALDYASSQGTELYRDFHTLISVGKRDTAAHLAFADRLAVPANEAAFTLFVDMVQEWLYRQVSNPRGPETDTNAPSPAPAVRPIDAAQAWQYVAQATQNRETYNLDRKQTALDILNHLVALARER